MTTTISTNPLDKMTEALRAEAAVEVEAPSTTPPTKKTEIIAIYGKGGIGKSFTLANLSYMMAQRGQKVLLIGCDPKSDTTSLLFGGRACPTIIDTSAKKKQAGAQVEIGDVCFKRDGVFAMELGGPEVGRGCGGRGIIHGFETLEKLGFNDWEFDYVLLDFSGRRRVRWLWSADRAGYVPESDRRWFQRPAVTLRRQQRLFGDPILSGSWAGMSALRAWSSIKTTVPAKPWRSRSRLASRFLRRFRSTMTSGARARTTRSSADQAASGRRCSTSSL